MHFYRYVPQSEAEEQEVEANAALMHIQIPSPGMMLRVVCSWARYQPSHPCPFA